MLQVGYIIHMGVIDSIEKKGSEVISDHLAKSNTPYCRVAYK